MTPVFLVTLAYRISLDIPAVPAAGMMMIQGQVHDMRQGLDGSATEDDRLLHCYRLKSAALYGPAVKMGAS